MEAIRENIASGTSARELTDANGDVVKISDGAFSTFWGPVEFNSRGQNEGRAPTTVQVCTCCLLSAPACVSGGLSAYLCAWILLDTLLIHSPPIFSSRDPIW